MFEIICLGRIDFLMRVLNGLAMLTSNTGPAGYGGMVALGLLIGVLLAMARAVVTQRLELQWVLAGWLLFSCLFVPKVTVTVEDIYTGTTNTVANVPLGPAAIGSITSTLGVRLAQAFETVFAVPGLTTGGYMDSLELINAMRNLDYGAANDGSSARTVVPNVDVRKTVREYLTNCVMQAMTMGVPNLGPTWTQLKEAPDILTAIQVNTNILTTTVYLNSSNPAGVSTGCFNAYTEISTFIRGSFFPAWTSYIAGQVGVVDPQARIQDALDSIFGIGQDAQLYMLNSLFKVELELAELGYQASRNNDAGVLMRVQAMEQRRMQWAAEQSMWAEMARPAISFIEGFFYAASPFMGFMFCLGAPGIAIFARYMVFAIWIQMWMPILAICNLYITVAAANDLQRIDTSGTILTSMTGLDSVWTETASWLAFGGNMVAATPLLSLVLITGSYFALTSLTSRLSGADHVNEKVAAPDVMSPAAFATVGGWGTQQSQYTSSPIHGLTVNNVASLLPKFNVSSDMRSTVESAQGAQRRAAAEASAVLSTALNLSHQSGREQFKQNSMSRGTDSTYSQADSVTYRIAESALKGIQDVRSLTKDDVTALQTAIGVGMQASMSGNSRTGEVESDSFTETAGRQASQTASQSASETVSRSTSPHPGERWGQHASEQRSRSVSESQSASNSARSSRDRAAGRGSSRNVGADAGIQLALRNVRSISDAQRQEVARRIENMTSSDSTFMAQFAEKVKEDTSNGISSRFLANMGVEDSERWAKAMSDTMSANEDFRRASSLTQMAGSAQSIDPIAVGHHAVQHGWADDLYRELSANKISQLDVEGQARVLAGWTGANYQDVKAAVAANYLWNRTNESRMDVMEAMGRNGFLTPSVNLSNPQKHEHLEGEAPKFGVANDRAESHVTATNLDPNTVRNTVESNIGVAEDLQKEGEIAVQEFFLAVQARNPEKAAEALERVRAVDTRQQAEHQASTFKEERGLMEYLMDADIRGQVFDLDTTTSGLGAASKALSDTWSSSRAQGDGVFSSAWSALKAVPPAYTKGFQDEVRSSYDAAYQKAHLAGLPEAAAQFYADQHILTQQDLAQSVPRFFGTDEAYNQRREQARAELGDVAFEMLDRASTGEPVTRAINFRGAAAIYNAKVLDKGKPKEVAAE